MQYKITEENLKPHLDIESDIGRLDNGVLTFTIRVNKGKIVDYAPTEYVDVRKYLRLKSVTYTELSISHNSGEGGSGYPVRGDNSKRTSDKESGTTG